MPAKKQAKGKKRSVAKLRDLDALDSKVKNVKGGMRRKRRKRGRGRN